MTSAIGLCQSSLIGLHQSLPRSTPDIQRGAPHVNRSPGKDADQGLRSTHSRIRPTAASRQEPDAAHRPAARRRHSAAPGPARPARPDQDSRHRPLLRGHERGGDAIFGNLALLFAVGVAIGFAKKADGSTALSAVAGYLVMTAVFKSMSPVVLAGVMNSAGTQAQINYSVFGGILIGLITAWLFDKYHDIQLPPYLGFFGGRRFVPIVVSLSTRPSCGLSARPAWSRSATTCRPSSAPRPTRSKATSTTPWWPTRPIRSRPSRPSKRSPRPPRWPRSTCPAPPSWRRSPAVRWR
ncbi:membrane protein of unknown function [Micropruina glycogenica]|uniref:Phosphotransferase system EIIC domain-containing protein n=1 Tax=Micropruina glycogenica TaxID=75385 RepID=A0A2N9JJ25_9ACTN|nr:membrane protein of unknown function [Micropruina glycogenica]